MNTSLEERERNFIKRFNSKYPTFEYIGGYENSDKPVLIRCKKCGNEFKRLAQIVRTCKNRRKNLICDKCNQLNKAVKNHIIELTNQYNKEQIELKKQYDKEINRQYKWLKQHTLYIKHCKYCGNELIVDNIKKEICSKCYHKHNKKHSSKSLQRLYKRDNGICYLCGGKCNLEDYIVRDGTIICGDYYPSIEHIIPISKGGTDNWDNLKLAHRICNSLKRDKQLI